MRTPSKQWSNKREHHLVDIAPAPVLPRLKGLDNRMIGRVEMPGRVLILRVVTAAHMSTGETEAQVDPGVTGFQTLLAAVCTRGDLSYLVKMCTVLCHRPFHSFHPEQGVVLMSSCYPSKDFPGCSEAVPSMNVVSRR